MDLYGKCSQTEKYRNLLYTPLYSGYREMIDIHVIETEKYRRLMHTLYSGFGKIAGIPFIENALS